MFNSRAPNRQIKDAIFNGQNSLDKKFIRRKLNFVNYTQIVFGGVVGAIIGGFIVHFLTIWRESGNRKRIFNGFIQSLVYELDAFTINNEAIIKKGNPAFLYDWQQNAIPSLRIECARIRQDIRCKHKQDRLAALLGKFSTECDRNVEPYKDLRYQTQIDRLKSNLLEMMDCTKFRIPL
jgi:hypothetical protein